jgi:preprotein translocase subunit SecA
LKRGYQKNALALSSRIRNLGDKIVEASRNRSNWGFAKELMVEAQAAGVEISDPSAFQQFVKNRNARAMADRLEALLPPRQEPVRIGSKVGRNEACPCGSGKKFKRCCAGKFALVETWH